MIKAALYLILLLGLAAWAFVSRDCRSEEEAELSPFLRIFQRMAVHIWICSLQNRKTLSVMKGIRHLAVSPVLNMMGIPGR